MSKLIEYGVSMPLEAFLAKPYVNWSHIDGPLMTWAGELHWLTMRERAGLWFKTTTVEDIAQKRFGRARV